MPVAAEVLDAIDEERAQRLGPYGRADALLVTAKGQKPHDIETFETLKAARADFELRR